MKQPCLKAERRADQIVDGVWIGGIDAASDHEFFDRQNITRVINLTRDVDDYFPDHFSYHRVALDDRDSCGLRLNRLFDQIADLIDRSRRRGETLLVHCKRGHHRSAAAIGSYLIKYLDWDYCRVIDTINTLRPCAMRRQTCMVDGLREYARSKAPKYRFNRRFEPVAEAVRESSRVPPPEPTLSPAAR